MVSKKIVTCFLISMYALSYPLSCCWRAKKVAASYNVHQETLLPFSRIKRHVFQVTTTGQRPLVAGANISVSPINPPYLSKRPTPVTVPTDTIVRDPIIILSAHIDSH